MPAPIHAQSAAPDAGPRPQPLVVTIDLRPRAAPPAPGEPNDFYLLRLQASSADAARLREALDLVPVATLIVDRGKPEALTIPFVSNACACLLGLDERQPRAITTTVFLTCFEPPQCAAFEAALRDVSTATTFDSAVRGRHAVVPIRVTLTALDADLGDSVLCTLIPRP